MKKVQRFLYGKFSRLVPAAIALILLSSCFSLPRVLHEGIIWDYGIKSLEALVGEEFIYLPREIAAYKAASIDLGNTYKLVSIDLDREDPKVCSFHFENNLGEKEQLDIPVYSDYRSESFDLIGRGVLDESNQMVSRGEFYRIYTHGKINLKSSYRWVGTQYDEHTFGKGFHHLKMFMKEYNREMASIAYRESYDNERRRTQEENSNLASPYGANIYVDFESELRGWKNLMTITSGSVPDAGWVYPAAKSIYYIPLTKVNIVEGYDPDTYFLEYVSTDYGVSSAKGYVYYKRFAIRDTIGVVRPVKTVVDQTFNLGPVETKTYKITKPFMLKPSYRTTIQYKSGERQSVVLFETVAPKD